MSIVTWKPNRLFQSLAFVTTPFAAPTYNFPLFLFGLYAAGKTDSNEPLRLVRLQYFRTIWANAAAPSSLP